MQTSHSTPPENTASSIKEVTAQNFMQEVMQASLQLPVLLYFTATWCGPCKQFGPVLEKVVNESKGKIRLARVDVDKNPQIAQQFRIQSVPMVYIIIQGQPVDAFAGALPESQVRQLVAQLLSATPQGQEMLHSLEEAKKLLIEGKPEQALPHFAGLLEEDSKNIEAISGAASAYVMLGDLQKAEMLLGQVPETSANAESVLSAKTALQLAKNAPGRDELINLTARLASNELDHAARMELAKVHFASGKQEAAINELLFIISKDKNWNDGEARTQLLAFFEALGHAHPLTMQGRRKLSSILFA